MAPGPPPVARVQEAIETQIPFSIEVVQERNDGVELEVHAKLLSAFSWDPDSVAVRVTGLNQGEKTQEFGSTLSDLLTQKVESLSPGGEYLFSLVIPGSGLSDYQLEVLWGKDAEAVLGRQLVAGKSKSGVVLSDLEVVRRMNCDGTADCLVYHELRGVLENTGAKVANSIVVAVGYLSRASEELDLSNEIPENETPVTIPGEPLIPGERRTVRVQLESALTEEQDTQYVPTMRVLAIEPERGSNKHSG